MGCRSTEWGHHPFPPAAHCKALPALAAVLPRTAEGPLCPTTQVTGEDAQCCWPQQPPLRNAPLTSCQLGCEFLTPDLQSQTPLLHPGLPCGLLSLPLFLICIQEYCMSKALQVSRYTLILLTLTSVLLHIFSFLILHGGSRAISRIKTLDLRRADFGLFKELLAEITWARALEGRGSKGAGHSSNITFSMLRTGASP